MPNRLINATLKSSFEHCIVKEWKKLLESRISLLKFTCMWKPSRIDGKFHFVSRKFQSYGISRKLYCNGRCAALLLERNTWCHEAAATNLTRVTFYNEVILVTLYLTRYILINYSFLIFLPICTVSWKGASFTFHAVVAH